MERSKIEWTDYSINPIKGKCPVACSYCYARRLYDRFKWNPQIRYTDPGFTIAEILTIKRPSKIFVGSTMELFWDWPEIWLRDTFTIIKQFPQHTFIFLTKRPEGLIKFSPFPDNCFIGVSVVSNGTMSLALTNLAIIKAKVKFISFEPLLGMIGMNDHLPLKTAGISWVIIGAQTPYSVKTAPRIEWVREIVEACDKAGIPVFQKNNLRTLLGDNLRQEFPELRS